MSKVNVAVFASGRGTNFQSIVNANIETADILVLVCNNPAAYAINVAKMYGIDCVLVNHKDFTTRMDFEVEILRKLEKYEIELVVLAGFMRLLTPFFISKFKNRIMNLHPSLLPSFPGMHAVRQAINYGSKVTGCTVHFVDDGTDTGPIIMQSVVQIADNDTENSLLEKIHEQEHKIYPKAIKLFCESSLIIEGRKVLIK